jgi:hypothetical protein
MTPSGVQKVEFQAGNSVWISPRRARQAATGSIALWNTRNSRKSVPELVPVTDFGQVLQGQRTQILRKSPHSPTLVPSGKGATSDDAQHGPQLGWGGLGNCNTKNPQRKTPNQPCCTRHSLDPAWSFSPPVDATNRADAGVHAPVLHRSAH